MISSRSPAAVKAAERRLYFDDVTLPLHDYVKILRLALDLEMLLDRHLKNVAYLVFLHVSVLRRLAGYLDTMGVIFPYTAHIRPYQEYAALRWMSSVPSHMWRLDTMEQRQLGPLGAPPWCYLWWCSTRILCKECYTRFPAINSLKFLVLTPASTSVSLQAKDSPCGTPLRQPRLL